MRVLPSTFNWPLFWVALLMMASPVLHTVAFLRARSGAFRLTGSA
jgi:hypothetical protein